MDFGSLKEWRVEPGTKVRLAGWDPGDTGTWTKGPRVQKALDTHPLVEAFWDAGETHLGATVARLIPSP